MKLIPFGLAVIASTLLSPNAQARSYACRVTTQESGASLILQRKNVIIDDNAAVFISGAQKSKLGNPAAYGCLAGARQLALNNFDTAEFLITGDSSDSTITVEQRINRDNSRSDCSDRATYNCDAIN